MLEDLIVPAMEWEPLSIEGSCKFQLPEGNPVGQGFQNIHISRNGDWQLKATASSTSYQHLPADLQHGQRAGQMMLPIHDIAATDSNSSLVLRDAHLVE